MSLSFDKQCLPNMNQIAQNKRSYSSSSLTGEAKDALLAERKGNTGNDASTVLKEVIVRMERVDLHKLQNLAKTSKCKSDTEQLDVSVVSSVGELTKQNVNEADIKLSHKSNKELLKSKLFVSKDDDSLASKEVTTYSTNMNREVKNINSKSMSLFVDNVNNTSRKIEKNNTGRKELVVRVERINKDLLEDMLKTKYLSDTRELRTADSESFNSEVVHCDQCEYTTRNGQELKGHKLVKHKEKNFDVNAAKSEVSITPVVKELTKVRENGCVKVEAVKNEPEEIVEFVAQQESDLSRNGWTITDSSEVDLMPMDNILQTEVSGSNLPLLSQNKISSDSSLGHYIFLKNEPDMEPSNDDVDETNLQKNRGISLSMNQLGEVSGRSKDEDMEVADVDESKDVLVKVGDDTLETVDSEIHQCELCGYLTNHSWALESHKLFQHEETVENETTKQIVSVDRLTDETNELLKDRNVSLRPKDGNIRVTDSGESKDLPVEVGEDMLVVGHNKIIHCELCGYVTNQSWRLEFHKLLKHKETTESECNKHVVSTVHLTDETNELLKDGSVPRRLKDERIEEADVDESRDIVINFVDDGLEAAHGEMLQCELCGHLAYNSLALESHKLFQHEETVDTGINKHIVSTDHLTGETSELQTHKSLPGNPKDGGIGVADSGESQDLPVEDEYDILEVADNEILQCELCGHLVHHSWVLEAHMQFQHNQQKQVVTTDHLADETNDTSVSGSLNETAPNEVLQCDLCGYQTNHRWLLESHKLFQHEDATENESNEHRESTDHLTDESNELLEDRTASKSLEDGDTGVADSRESRDLVVKVGDHMLKVVSNERLRCELCRYQTYNSSCLESHKFLKHKETVNNEIRKQVELTDHLTDETNELLKDRSVSGRLKDGDIEETALEESRDLTTNTEDDTLEAVHCEILQCEVSGHPTNLSTGLESCKLFQHGETVENEIGKHTISTDETNELLKDGSISRRLKDEDIKEADLDDSRDLTGNLEDDILEAAHVEMLQCELCGHLANDTLALESHKLFQHKETVENEISKHTISTDHQTDETNELLKDTSVSGSPKDIDTGVSDSSESQDLVVEDEDYILKAVDKEIYQCELCGHLTYHSWVLEAHMQFQHNQQKQVVSTDHLTDERNEFLKDRKVSGSLKDGDIGMADSVESGDLVLEVGDNMSKRAHDVIFQCELCGYQTTHSWVLKSHKLFQHQDTAENEISKQILSTDHLTDETNELLKERAVSKRLRDVDIEVADSSMSRVSGDHMSKVVSNKSLHCELCGYQTYHSWRLESHKVHKETVDNETNNQIVSTDHLTDETNELLKDKSFSGRPRDGGIEVADSNQSKDLVVKVGDHMLRVVTKERIRCGLCGYQTNNSWHLQCHKRSHYMKTADKQLVSTDANLCENLVGRSGNPRFKCHICQCQTKNLRNLKHHNRMVHSDFKMYECNVCGYKTKHKKWLKTHKLGRHSDIVFECHMCRYQVKYKRRLVDHIRMEHSGRLKMYHCDICTYKSNYSRNLKMHKLQKHRKKEFKCHVCQFRCTSKILLKNHIHHDHDTSSSSVEKYQCDICGYKTVEISNLRRHMLAVHNDRRKRFECHTCHRLLKTKSALRTHLKNGNCKTGLAFSCDVCGYTTDTKLRMKQHVFTVHRGIPVLHKSTSSTLENQNYVSKSNGIKRSAKEASRVPKVIAGNPVHESNERRNIKRIKMKHPGDPTEQEVICNNNTEDFDTVSNIDQSIGLDESNIESDSEEMEGEDSIHLEILESALCYNATPLADVTGTNLAIGDDLKEEPAYDESYIENMDQNNSNENEGRDFNSLISELERNLPFPDPCHQDINPMDQNKSTLVSYAAANQLGEFCGGFDIPEGETTKGTNISLDVDNSRNVSSQDTDNTNTNERFECVNSSESYLQGDGISQNCETYFCDLCGFISNFSQGPNRDKLCDLCYNNYNITDEAKNRDTKSSCSLMNERNKTAQEVSENNAINDTPKVLKELVVKVERIDNNILENVRKNSKCKSDTEQLKRIVSEASCSNPSQGKTIRKQVPERHQPILNSSNELINKEIDAVEIQGIDKNMAENATTTSMDKLEVQDEISAMEAREDSKDLSEGIGDQVSEAEDISTHHCDLCQYRTHHSWGLKLHMLSKHQQGGIKTPITSSGQRNFGSESRGSLIVNKKGDLEAQIGTEDLCEIDSQGDEGMKMSKVDKDIDSIPKKSPLRFLNETENQESVKMESAEDFAGTDGTENATIWLDDDDEDTSLVVEDQSSISVEVAEDTNPSWNIDNATNLDVGMRALIPSGTYDRNTVAIEDYITPSELPLQDSKISVSGFNKTNLTFAEGTVKYKLPIGINNCETDDSERSEYYTMLAKEVAKEFGEELHFVDVDQLQEDDKAGTSYSLLNKVEETTDEVVIVDEDIEVKENILEEKFEVSDTLEAPVERTVKEEQRSMIPERYHCDFCNFESDSIQPLKSHVVTDHIGPSGRAEEQECVDRSRKQIAKVNSKVLLHCTLCQFTTYSKNSLKKHKASQHEPNIFQCQICQFQTKYITPLVSHMRNTHGKRVAIFSCNLCEYSSNYMTSLKNHKLRKHSITVTNYSCHICQFQSKSITQLINHVRNVHDKDTPEESTNTSVRKMNKKRTPGECTKYKDTQFRCAKCEYTTESKQWLEEHIKTKHGLRVNRYKCPRCRFSTSICTELLDHVNQKHGGKIYLCNICKYETNNQQDFSSHRKEHRRKR